MVKIDPVFLIFANCAAWFIIQAGTAWLCSRMTNLTLTGFDPFLKSRSWEQDGKIYEKFFKIKKWKSTIPSAGTFFKGGFSLKRIDYRDSQYLKQWINETYRAELTHWFALLPVLIFYFWNPPAGLIINLIYALTVNLPCILVQRYNRPRLIAFVDKHNGCNKNVN